MIEQQTRKQPALPSRVFKKDIEYQRGYFVAANVKRDENGKALFGQVNSELVEKMQRERLCQLCGRRIAKTDWCVFPGGVGLVKYQEAPLHIDCARYSALVCPRIQRVQESFGFSVCRKYIHVECEAPNWHDPGCIPVWDNLREWERSLLLMAHDIYYDTEDGTWKCRSCKQGNAGMMYFDEFMKWTERLGYG